MTNRNRCSCTRILLTPSLLIVATAFIGCSSSERAASSSTQGAAAAAAPASSAQQPAAPATTPPVDACALLSKADVESVAGKSVLDGVKEQAGPLVTCSFGDPTAPKVGGRSISDVLSLAVMTGQEGAYYKGPNAQAKDSLKISRENAASDEPVSGLGDVAYWDKILRTLHVASGRYEVTVTVESRDDGLAVARAAAVKALAKLPK